MFIWAVRPAGQVPVVGPRQHDLAALQLDRGGDAPASLAAAPSWRRAALAAAQVVGDLDAAGRRIFGASGSRRSHRACSTAVALSWLSRSEVQRLELGLQAQALDVARLANRFRAAAPGSASEVAAIRDRRHQTCYEASSPLDPGAVVDGPQRLFVRLRLPPRSSR